MTALLLLAAAAAVIAVTVYAVSLRLHPWMPCRACGGSGKTSDRLWHSAHGTCRACGGRGRNPRLGIRVLQPSRYKRLMAGQAGHKSIDKRD